MATRFDWQERYSSMLGMGVLMLVIAMLQGCASLSEGECMAANWEVLGESDGQQGRPLSQLNRYQKDCAQYGVVPDARAYASGRERGLSKFCTESNGYGEGRAGIPNQSVCPPALQPGFRRGYDIGHNVHAAHYVLITTADGIRQVRNEIVYLKDRIKDSKARLSQEELSQDEAGQLRREIGSWERQIERLEDDLLVLAGSVALSIAQYSSAVRAARTAGYDEPMEAELIYELQRLAR